MLRFSYVLSTANGDDCSDNYMINANFVQIWQL